jgi:hypothetical protein
MVACQVPQPAHHLCTTFSAHEMHRQGAILPQQLCFAVAAAEVSAIGNGGQVLLDEASAAALQGQQLLHHGSSNAGSSWLPRVLLRR